MYTGSPCMYAQRSQLLTPSTYVDDNIPIVLFELESRAPPLALTRAMRMLEKPKSLECSFNLDAR